MVRGGKRPWRDDIRGVQRIRTSSTSRPLHSGGLSSPSLSLLTSPLKPVAPTSPPPTSPAKNRAPPARPPRPAGSAPPFTRDPALDSVCLSLGNPLPLTHTHTPEGPYCLRGHSPNMGGVGGGGQSSCSKKGRITDVKFKCQFFSAPDEDDGAVMNSAVSVHDF